MAAQRRRVLGVRATQLGRWLTASLGLSVLGLAACIAVTRPVVKIGLVAPFEGRYRDVGYEVIYAVRLAVREANAAGGVAGYSVELVALDDAGDPAMAAEQARKLAVDPQIVGALGHWLEPTTLAAAPEYAQAGLPVLATAAGGDLPAPALRLWRRSACFVETDRGCAQALEDLKLAGAAAVTVTVPAPLPADSADPAFAERYLALSNGVQPRFNAVLAYDAARLLLDALARDIAQNKTPTRVGVGAMLAASTFTGLSGPFHFDSARNWADARTWTYLWSAGVLTRP